jgi:MYXO-CTERM domain-containing protein
VASGSAAAPVVAKPKKSGCGCATGGDGDGAILLVGALLFVRRRRR